MEMLDLPEDITFFNILARVPAKTAGLCRCVSRKWRNMLSHPDFIKTHLHISKINSPESLVIVGNPFPGIGFKRQQLFYTGPLTDSHDKITLPLTNLDLDSRFYVSGSCDGLLLFRDYSHDMIVINPVTRVIRKLPPPPFELFHSNKSVFGFAYHPLELDYKIVIFTYEYRLSYTKAFVHILSLRTGDWRRLESSHGIRLPPPTEGSIPPVSIPAVFLGGSLHWLHNNALVSFNLVDEMVREIQLPKVCLGSCKLVVVGGCLGIYSIINNEVWVMKEYGVPQSLIKFITNFISDSMFKCFFFNRQPQFLAGICTQNNFAMCDLKDGTSKKVVIEGFDDSKYPVAEDASFYEIYPVVEASFVESLVSPYLGQPQFY